VPTAPPSLAASLRAAGFGGAVLANEPLAGYTTWRIGGPAEVLAVPRDAGDLLRALAWARDARVAWRILGNGSNVLVPDAGVRGLVLRTKGTLDAVASLDTGFEVGAGTSLPALAHLAATRGLTGLEFAAGIPGTVGGAVLMNAGWHEYEIGAAVHWVESAAEDGRVERAAAAACGFRYRGSVFRGARAAILRCRIDLRPDDPQRIRARMDDYLASRRRGQPIELPSCGSVYLKPPGDFAGRLIEAAGLKGVAVGGIRVSPKHANFFVNVGSGTAADALELMARVEAVVLERFGVRLEREVEVW
jgi:UDP-N-acetylmuramate dehydrogenase